jgi:hypothetical protein
MVAVGREGSRTIRRLSAPGFPLDVRPIKDRPCLARKNVSLVDAFFWGRLPRRLFRTAGVMTQLGRGDATELA